MKIVASNNYYSSDSAHDWIAYKHGEEESVKYGIGETEAEAMANFLSNHITDKDALEIVHKINNHDTLVVAIDSVVTWLDSNQDCNFPISVYLALKSVLNTAKGL